MQLTGQSYIGSQRSALNSGAIYAVNPATGEKLYPAYCPVSAAETERTVQLAAQAFPVYAATSGKQRAGFLRKIADGLDAMQKPIAERAHLETALSMPRLLGEVSRTTGQLRLFAGLLEEGSWVDARIDTPLPERKPFPRPGMRSMLRPIGPVVVFGASNFPLAFSAAGGDTASALAAGSPVIVKAHSAHPGTSEMVAGVLQQAVEACGMPEGTFSLLYGSGSEIGTALVRHPAMKAVAFTGSLRGGRALMDLAASRPQPIPCFTEMSAVNPVFVLPGALRRDAETLAQNLFNSFTLGSGQFCTKPGIVFFVDQPEAKSFVATLKSLVEQATPFTLLTRGIEKEYTRGIEERSSKAALAAKARPGAATTACRADAQLYLTTLEEYLSQPQLAAEIFGPTTLLVKCRSTEEFLRAAESQEGQLTATLFGEEEELVGQRPLLSILEKKAGRLIFNAFPTGVEVSHAMVHGGPYPATADARFTSVGSQAIYRFVRPVCFQDFPDGIAPAELQAANPLGIERMVDGVLSREPLLRE